MVNIIGELRDVIQVAYLLGRMLLGAARQCKGIGLVVGAYVELPTLNEVTKVFYHFVYRQHLPVKYAVVSFSDGQLP